MKQITSISLYISVLFMHFSTVNLRQYFTLPLQRNKTFITSHSYINNTITDAKNKTNIVTISILDYIYILITERSKSDLETETNRPALQSPVEQKNRELFRICFFFYEVLRFVVEKALRKGKVGMKEKKSWKIDNTRSANG